MTDARITELVARAIDYRGYVTLSRRDHSQLVGYVYKRDPDHVELFDEQATGRLRVAIDDIADIALTGDDAAARAQAIWERRRGQLEPHDTPLWGGWEDRATLLVVALPLELRGIARAIGAKPHGSIAIGRLGDRRAVGLAVGLGGGSARAIAEHGPGLVISCGFSAGLDPSLRPGDIVLATSVCDDDRDSMAVAEPVLRSARAALRGVPHVAEGEIVCTTRVAVTRADKRVLARPGRLAVDLESWAAAYAARNAGIPWLAIRVVLDPMDGALPAFTRDPHAGYVLPALRHALRGPRAMFELARCGSRARVASRSLQRALACLAPMVGSVQS